MKAVVFTEDRTLSLEDVPIPAVQSDEVLIRSKYCGICGTDLHATDFGGLCAYKPGVVIGHEFAGIVEEVGNGVRTVTRGDRVTVHPNRNVCGKCYTCRVGEYHLCPQVWETCAGIFVPGGMAEYVSAKEGMVFKLPDGLKLHHGALVEPLATALHAVRRSGFTVGDSGLILGAGPIGLLALQCLRMAGARRCYVAEPSASRRALALRLGADEVIDPSAPNRAELSEWFDPSLPLLDFVFECSGDPAGLETGARLVNRGGTVVLVGISLNPLTLDPMTLISKEVVIRGSTDYNEEFGQAIDMLAHARIAVDELITATLPIGQFGQAFDMLRRKEAIKVLLEI